MRETLLFPPPVPCWPALWVRPPRPRERRPC